MQNSPEKTALIRLFLLFVVAVVILLITMAILSVGHDWGYREGQMDALKGKQMFEMQVQPDTLYIQKPQ